MSNLSRHFSHKPHKLFSRFFNVSDHPKVGDIDDDWEFIEVLDQELGSAGDEDEDAESDVRSIEMIDPIDAEDPLKIKYRILSKADVRERLENKLTKLSTVLLLSRIEAVLLLHHFKWSLKRTQEEWLTCEDKVRKAVGLFERPVVETPDSVEVTCRFCRENFPGDKLLAVSCGHQFCRSCWTDYIRDAISGGPGCLQLRCPDCDAAVGLDMIEMLSSEDDKKRFADYLFKSYVTDRKKAKLCPAPGCDYVVFVSAGGDYSSNVTCRCLYSFCWKCSIEAHAPVDCAAACEWMSEINAQSDNWLLANTRPCPKCGQPIEKDSCFMYSRCTICDYVLQGDNGQSQPAPEFDWSYRSIQPERHKVYGLSDDNDHGRERAWNRLERFNHYYEGWATSESSKANALTDLTLLQDMQLERLCDIWGVCANDLDFLVEAQLQVVECWRILKWSYVYGYFLSPDDNTKKPLLEFMQEQATDLLKMLEKCVDALQDVLMEDISVKKLTDYRVKLVQLTRVTRNYFQRLVEGLKAGLSEVMSVPLLSPNLSPRLKISPDEARPSPNITRSRSVDMKSELKPKSVVVGFEISPTS